MKKMQNRVLAGVLACTMVLTVSACGKSATGDGSGGGTGGKPGAGAPVTATVNKDLVFRETSVEALSSALSEDSGNVTLTDLREDKLLLAGIKWGKDSGNGGIFTLTADMDGGNAEYKLYGEVANRIVDYLAPVFDEEGNLYTLKTDYGEMTDDMREEVMPADGAKDFEENAFEEGDGSAEDGGDGEETDPADDMQQAPVVAEATPDDGEYVEPEDPKYFLMKFDKDGNTIFETEINPTDFVSDDEWFGVYDIYYLAGQCIVLRLETGLYLCSLDDGSFVRTVYKMDPGVYMEICRSGDGAFYLYTRDDQGVSALKELNTETGVTGADIRLPQSVNNDGFGAGSLKPGKATDFLILKQDGIASWNIGDDAVKEILSYSDSDLSINYLETVLAISDSKFFVTYSGQSPEGEYKFYTSFLDKVNPEDVADKKVLTIGMLYADGNLRNRVLAFNRQSSTYKIKMIDYSQYNADGDWEAGNAKFISDIATGTGPDMMCLDPSLPVQSFEAKGLFEPLDDYLANDPEISQREYVTSVLDTFKYKDTTYMMVPSFSAYTYVMKKSIADTLTQWDMKTFDRMMTDRDLEYAIVFGNPMDQQTFLQMCLTFDASSFMDWNTGEAKFDSQQFIDLLNFTKKLPESVEDWDDAGNWRELETAFRNDKALVSQAVISNYKLYSQLRHAVFGEDISFVGFPRTEGAGGAAALCNAMIAMNAQSAEKDACWEFMRIFYLDDYQNTIVKDDWQLPIARKQLDEVAQKAMQKPYYMDGDKKVEYDDSFWLEGQEIVIPPMTQAEVDTVNRYFDSIDAVVCYDRKVFNIIAEEAAPFFKGQKTAEECAAIIQSKLQLYMDENS